MEICNKCILLKVKTIPLFCQKFVMNMILLQVSLKRNVNIIISQYSSANTKICQNRVSFSFIHVNYTKDFQGQI